MGQLFSLDARGGYFSTDILSNKIRHASQPLMKFRQFVDAENAAGRRRGDTFLFDKISNISTAGGTLIETETIPRSNYTITQGSLQITEYGNSIPFTLKLETLSQAADVPDSIKTVLRDDQAKVLDSAASVEFLDTDYVCVITSTAASGTIFTTDGTATATATGNMSDVTFRNIIDQMKKLLIPRYDGSNYVNIASTNQVRGLYDFFEAKAVNTTMDPSFNGEVGRYYGCRVIEETNILSNTTGGASISGEGVFFGADAVKEGLVVPENIRVDVPRDFGRDQSMAWYAFTGFQKTWDLSADGETRIIKVTSA